MLVSSRDLHVFLKWIPLEDSVLKTFLFFVMLSSIYGTPLSVETLDLLFLEKEQLSSQKKFNVNFAINFYLSYPITTPLSINTVKNRNSALLWMLTDIEFLTLLYLYLIFISFYILSLLSTFLILCTYIHIYIIICYS